MLKLYKFSCYCSDRLFGVEYCSLNTITVVRALFPVLRGTKHSRTLGAPFGGYLFCDHDGFIFRVEVDCVLFPFD